MSGAVLWARLQVIVAGRVAERLARPVAAGARDRVCFHEAGHALLAWQTAAWVPQSAGVWDSGGAVSWSEGERAELIRAGSVENDSRMARRFACGLLAAADVVPTFKAARLMIRAAEREAEVSLRRDWWGLLRLASELFSRGSLSRADLEAIRETTGAGRPLSARERAAAGLPDLGAVLAEARRRPAE